MEKIFLQLKVEICKSYLLFVINTRVNKLFVKKCFDVVYKTHC